MVRAVPRGYTVCADAYLTPKIRQYLKGFTSGFEGGLKVRFARNPPPRFSLLQSQSCQSAFFTQRRPPFRKQSVTFPVFLRCLQDVDVLFMQSDGGLTPMEQFCGSRAVLSGPAGGVVGYAITSYSQMEKKPVIGFDMGGEWRPQ